MTFFGVEAQAMVGSEDQTRSLQIAVVLALCILQVDRIDRVVVRAEMSGLSGSVEEMVKICGAVGRSTQISQLRLIELHACAKLRIPQRRQNRRVCMLFRDWC